MKKHLVHDKNCIALRKSIAYLQSIMLYWAETKTEEIEDNGKGPIFLPSSATVPYQKQSIEPTLDPPSFSPNNPFKFS